MVPRTGARHPRGQKENYPCGIIFRYQRYLIPGEGFIISTGELLELDIAVQGTMLTGEPVRVSSVAARAREEFSVRCLIRLRRDCAVWEYSFEGRMEPSEKLESAPVWSFDPRPTLAVETRPDGRKEGNLGIGLELTAGRDQFECKKEGQPLTAHVEIKKLDATVVHQGDDDLGKFRFG